MAVVQTLKNAVHKAITPALKAVSAPIRPHGMLPSAFDAYLSTGYPSSRIGQTMATPGHQVAASADTHNQDGTLAGIPYAVCVDLHCRDLSVPQVKAMLVKLWSAGFVAWYRCADYPEDHWSGVTHIHALWPAAPCKLSCRNQVHDYCAVPSKTGLASHLPYHFLQPTQAQRDKIANAFLPHNPATG